MFLNKKKTGFTLAEVLVTLGLIGVVSALTIPTLAYNYKAKVLEEQFKATYSDIVQISSMINYQKGDIGTYANKLNYKVWPKEFMAMVNGGNSILADADSSNDITGQKRNYYKTAGSSPGPYAFNLSNAGSRQAVGDVCNNGGIWVDNKGRIWTFNAESRMVCVDINGTTNPNRLNIDTFVFIPMSADQVAAWVYDDPDNPNNYSGALVSCDLDKITRKNLSDSQPEKDKDGKWIVNKDNPKVALDTCPFTEPIENIAEVDGVQKGLSAKNKPITIKDRYWKRYIEYK